MYIAGKNNYGQLGLGNITDVKIFGPINRLALKVDVKLKEAVIPAELEKNLSTSYDLVNYVNNINLPNTEVLTEYRKKDKTETNYTYGLERLWGVQRVGTTGREIENYIYDGRGSVSALADQIGNVVTQYRYDPFGVMTKNEATEKSVFGYNGEEYNQAIESQYLRGRYYTPKAGRFSVEDSYQGNIVNPLSLNKYAYGLNNPLRYRDPSGHRAESGMEGAVSKPKTPSPGVTSNKNRQASPSDTVTRTPAGTTTVNKPAPSYPGVTPNKNRQSSQVNEVWVNPGGNYTSSHPVNKAQYGYTGALTNAVWNPPVAPPKPIVTSYDAKSRQASPSDEVGYMALQKEIARVAEEKRKKLCDGLEDSIAMQDGMLPGFTKPLIEWDNINWDRVVSGVAKAAGGIGGVLIGASAFTSGGGAMLIPGVGWCYGLPAILSGLAAVGTGGATFLEGIQDIWHGLTGSNSSSFNFIRDTAFKDNEDYYYLLEYASQYTAGITGSQANQVYNNHINSADFYVGPDGAVAPSLKNYDRYQYLISKGYIVDSAGRWQGPKGPDGKRHFVSHEEVGLPLFSSNNVVVEDKIHGNSLNYEGTNYGYVLKDKTTGEVLKYGETINPSTRYTKKYLNSINAEMEIMTVGNKPDIHDWQHQQIEKYRLKNGVNPPLNKSNW